MGYTHYWYRQEEIPLPAWRSFTSQVKAILSLKGTDAPPVAEESDTAAPPVVTDLEVVFNGVGDDGHETFYVARVLPKGRHRFRGTVGEKLPSGKKSVFTFCKTARKPYDKVVVACLYALKAALGDDAKIESDGNRANHADGQRLYLAATGNIGVELDCDIDEEGGVE